METVTSEAVGPAGQSPRGLWTVGPPTRSLRRPPWEAVDAAAPFPRAPPRPALPCRASLRKSLEASHFSRVGSGSRDVTPALRCSSWVWLVDLCCLGLVLSLCCFLPLVCLWCLMPFCLFSFVSRNFYCCSSITRQLCVSRYT